MPLDNQREHNKKEVADFWLIALKNNEITAEKIPEMKVFLSILRISSGTALKTKRVFEVEFFFDENPYFKNTIEWFPGKCLTRRILKKKPNKGSKNTKPITKTEDCESVFTFLSPPQVSDDEEDLDDDMVWAPPKHELGTFHLFLSISLYSSVTVSAVSLTSRHVLSQAAFEPKFRHELGTFHLFLSISLYSSVTVSAVSLTSRHVLSQAAFDLRRGSIKLLRD
ncbi:hypothetical protein YC2023_045487 [Brassica napus]